MPRIAATLLLIAVSATPLAAKPKHWHADEKHWTEHWHDDDDGDHARHAGCYVGPHDVRIVREYYEPRYRALPPGLAKKYARTGHLPPGWARRSSRCRSRSSDGWSRCRARTGAATSTAR